MAYTPSQIQAILEFANSSDEQKGIFQNQFGGDPNAYGQWFENWWQENFSKDSPSKYPADAKLLDALDWDVAASEQTGTASSMPMDQSNLTEVYNRFIAPGITGTGYQEQAASTLNRYLPQFQNAAQTLSQFQAAPDWGQYLRDNPDVAQVYSQTVAQYQNAGQTPPTAEQFAINHYNTYGRNEGRAAPAMVSNAYRGELAASNAATSEQLGALGAQIASLTSNLDGELASKGAALQQQLATYAQGLSQFGDAEKQAISQQLATEYGALETEVAAKKNALAQQLATMGEALTAEDAARKSALTEAVSRLEAAQAPLNAARVEGAKALQTSVNLGLESTRDQLAANQVAQGYTGGSSGTDMALARATIGARQNSAQAMSDANVANASDNAGIARFGATEGYGISTDTAKNRTGLTNFGAQETRGLSDYGATQTRGITSAGATANRNLSGVLNQGQLDLSKFGADQTRGLADYGATQTRGIRDTAANTTFNINDSAAQRKYGLFSQDLQRQLSLLGQPAQQAATEFSLLNAASDYSQTGVRNALNYMNQFRVPSNPAPMNQATQVQPNTATGSALVGLGGGLLNTAGTIGLTNYFKSQTPTTPATTTPKP